jgi:hypothetical protein
MVCGRCIGWMSDAGPDDGTITPSGGRRTRMRVVRAGQAGPTVDVVLVEVTSAGVGLLHAEPLETGDELMLVSAGRRAGEPASVLLFTVVGCRPNPAGGFAVDAQFHRTLPRRSDPPNDPAPETQPKSMRLAFVG